MTILWHRLGVDHPLVKQLDTLARGENDRLHRLERLKREQKGAELEATLPIELERAELRQQREQIEAEIRDFGQSPGHLLESRQSQQRRIQQQILAKQAVIERCQAELAHLRKDLAALQGATTATAKQLADQLACTRTTARKNTG